MQNCVIINGMPHLRLEFNVILGEDIHLHNKNRIFSFLIGQQIFRFYIILAWLLGLFVGLHIFPSLFLPQNRQLQIYVTPQQDFLLLLVFSYVPMAVTHICIHRKIVHLLPIVCLLKSSFFGFSLFLLRIRFTSGAWLAAILLLFTDIVNASLLLWFCLKRGANDENTLRKDTAIYIVALLISCSFDRLVLAPFILKII